MTAGICHPHTCEQAACIGQVSVCGPIVVGNLGDKAAGPGEVNLLVGIYVQDLGQLVGRIRQILRVSGRIEYLGKAS